MPNRRWLTRSASGLGRGVAIVALALLADALAGLEEPETLSLGAGIAAYEAGKYAEAAQDFKIARFLSLERPERHLEVLARLALAEDGAGMPAARDATLQRFLEVEGKFPQYRASSLEPDLRPRFDKLLVARLGLERIQEIPALAEQVGLAPGNPGRARSSPAPRPAVTRTSPSAPTSTPVPSPTQAPTETLPATETPAPSRTATPPRPSATATETRPPSPTLTSTPRPSSTPTASPTSTPRPTATATASATRTLTATASPTSTPRPTATATASATRTLTATASSTRTLTATASATGTATGTATATRTRTPTASATWTFTATASSTRTRTAAPTVTRTSTPTVTASITPTRRPSPAPSPTATASPTAAPTMAPSPKPSPAAVVPDAPPRPSVRIMPVYPERALKERVRGAVVLKVQVSEAGVPLNADVEKGVRADIDKAAIAAALQWRFDPATRDGRPVRGVASVRFSFEGVQFARTPLAFEMPTVTPRPR